ncbi:NUDIX domain-containing protein [Streptomyces sp. NRRL S-1868]|uniref:NUDIX domain-containing protein n=1 Tax=Streptomyces sp. NRRL S-1868 TaxID=1463892 RepID=UPI0004C47C2C|nr:NUDIX hydrolase [Streptomyces sp. NRRL S-1868]
MTIHTADVVAIRDGRVLLIERGWPPFKGYWALPGGHVDPGETLRVAAARELTEETGLHVGQHALTYLGRWGNPARDTGRDPRGHYVTCAYLAGVPAGVPVRPGTDAKDARWWPLDGLPRLVAFDHADIIRAARTRTDNNSK